MMLCYHCLFKSEDPNIVLTHIIENHKDKDVSIRQCVLHENTGQQGYTSIHFSISVKDILSKSHVKAYINSELKLKFKRTNTDIDVDEDAINDDNKGTPSTKSFLVKF